MAKMISLTVIEISELAKVGKYNCRRENEHEICEIWARSMCSWMITTS